VVIVTARDQQDEQALLNLQTGSEVEIRGRVDSPDCLAAGLIR
jgi:hypothetical protein